MGSSSVTGTFFSQALKKVTTLDLEKIEQDVFSKEEVYHFVEEMHRHGIKVVLDGVFNHCSWYFPYFDDVVRKGKQSEYVDWFYNLTFPLERPREGSMPEYACFAYEPKMPKLNTSNPKVQEYFANVGKYWIEEFHVDGWRLDVANEIDRNFWRTFRTAVKAANPEAVLIGEVWEDASNKEAYAPDGLHPNDAGHEILADLVEKFLLAL